MRTPQQRLIRKIKRLSLALLLVLGAYTLIQPRQVFRLPKKEVRAEIEAYMDQTRAKRFDDHGQLREIFHAARWEFRPLDERSYLFDVAADLYQADGTHWRVSADRGQGHQTNLAATLRSVDLEENVVVSRMHQDDPARRPWSLMTEQLTLSNQEATTGNPVQVLGPESVIDAVGLKANLESGYVEFLSKVRTRYHQHQNES